MLKKSLALRVARTIASQHKPIEDWQISLKDKMIKKHGAQFHTVLQLPCPDKAPTVSSNDFINITALAKKQGW